MSLWDEWVNASTVSAKMASTLFRVALSDPILLCLTHPGWGQSNIWSACQQLWHVQYKGLIRANDGIMSQWIEFHSHFWSTTMFRTLCCHTEAYVWMYTAHSRCSNGKTDKVCEVTTSENLKVTVTINTLSVKVILCIYNMHEDVCSPLFSFLL